MKTGKIRHNIANKWGNKMNLVKWKNRKKWVIPVCALVLLLSIGMIILFINGSSTPLQSDLDVEAGADSYNPADFLEDGTMADEISASSEIEVVKPMVQLGVSQDITVWLGDSVEPEDMLKSVDDEAGVTVTWEEAPDLEKEGEQSVTILLTNEDGNTQRLSATLTIIADREPPEILGAADQEVMLGDSVSYRSGVTVKDNRDDQVELTIDTSKVNLNAVGSYPVVYTATDQAGNRTEVIVTIVVRTVSQEEVIQLADDLLARITTTEMTNEEKCRAIYDWAQNSIKYVGTADKSDIYQGAYEGFTKLRGDCYTYYAVATVLLDRLGIPNMKVERIDSTHYWCLVDAGNGWYHFDCSPRRIGHYVDTCLVPDSVLERYSREEIEGYYDFDHSLYPERGE